MNNGPCILTDQETEELVERALLKHMGKTYRADGKDSLMQIEHDFPSLFGGEGKA